jgi:hypothetical protein
MNFFQKILGSKSDLCFFSFTCAGVPLLRIHVELAMGSDREQDGQRLSSEHKYYLRSILSGVHVYQGSNFKNFDQ